MHWSLAASIRAFVPAALAILLMGSTASAHSHAEHVTTGMPVVPPIPYEARFLEGMIDHHAMAVHMSELLRAQATHPELRALGDSIAAAQTAEIKQMQDWLQQWYGRAHEPAAMPAGMPGMAGMQGLEQMKGEAFEKEYLQMMIRHHAMAVRQAKECQRRGKHAELRHMCRHIGLSQQKEIVTMKGWLCRWYHKCS